jgi:hypothetical protein
MVATIDALSAAIVGLYAWVRAVHYYVRPWWALPTTIEAQKQVFNRGYRFTGESSAGFPHTVPVI